MSDPDDKYQWNPGGGGGAQASDLSSGLHATTTFQTTPVGATSVACKNVHWISVKLVRQSPLKKRPSWWPSEYKTYSMPYQALSASSPVTTRQEPQNLAYASEPYNADITTGKKVGSLNGQGAVRFDNIFAGTCQFKFVKFYDEIEQYFKDKLSK